MSYDYLVASLPSLLFGDVPSLTVEHFRMSCEGVLSEQDLVDLDLVLDGRAAEGASSAARQWHGYDTQIRNTLARHRSAARTGDSKGPLRDHPGYQVWIDKAIGDALSKANPLERERAIDRCRWNAASDLALKSSYGMEAVVAYAAQLQIAARWAGMNDPEGREKVEQFVQNNVKKIHQPG